MRMRDFIALNFNIFSGIMHMLAILINQKRKFIATELQIATYATCNAPQKQSIVKSLHSAHAQLAGRHYHQKFLATLNFCRSICYASTRELCAISEWWAVCNIVAVISAHNRNNVAVAITTSEKLYLKKKKTIVRVIKSHITTTAGCKQQAANTPPATCLHANQCRVQLKS